MTTKFLKTCLRHYHELSDQDFIWFPFLFLRPRPDQSIGLRQYVLMVFCFGLYGSLVWPLKQYLYDSSVTWNGWAVFTLKCFGFFLVWFAVVTVPLWNQRARNLRV